MLKKTNAWLWIPSLYFASGLPYHAITSISDIMYKDMGVDNTSIAFYTSILLVPWTIKPLWSPFVEMLGTRRNWTLYSQLLLVACFAAIALAVPSSNFVLFTLIAFMAGAFVSSTHDIALDGFYILALPQEKQSFFSGIRNTFYRIATVFSSGVLVMLAGSIAGNSEESNTYNEPKAEIATEETLGNIAVIEIIENNSNNSAPEEALTSTQTDTSFKSKFHIARNNMGKGGVFEWKGKLYNTYYYEEWENMSDNERKEFIKSATKPCYHKPDPPVNTNNKATELTYNNTTPPIIGTATSNEITATNNTASESPLSGSKDIKDRNSTAWSITFAVTALIMAAMFLYHRKAMPKPENDLSHTPKSIGDIFSNFGDIIKTYFQKPGIWATLFFLLLFRFPEAQLGKIGKLFLMDTIAAGGLELSKSDIGFLNGVVGVIGLIIGGIVGGICISRKGLKYWLWPMVVAISLPDIVYVYMSMFAPGSLTIIGSCIFIEQLGYGFGFTAYTLYMIYFAQGKYPTAHFAISTAFMSLGMMLPGMVSGYIQQWLGYENFFIWVMACTAITFAVSGLIKIDPNFGKK